MEAIGHNPPALKQQRGRAQKAFSLIEAAIVLAVVGGVIGTIWTVSASFYEDYRVNKAVEGFHLIAMNLQKLLSISDRNTLAKPYSLNATLLGAEAVPKDWVYGSTINSPVGGVVTFVLENGFEGASFNLFDVSVSECIKLTVEASTHAKNSRGGWLIGMGFIQFHAGPRTDVYLSAFPITPEQAANYCKTNMISSNSYLSLWVILTRIN